MKRSLQVAFFGPSIVSDDRCPAAAYYPGLLSALRQRAHRVTYYEPAAPDRQGENERLSSFANVVRFSPTEEWGVLSMVERARHVDVVVKSSHVGVYDALLEYEISRMRKGALLTVFWDVDPAATVERIRKSRVDALRATIPKFDLVLTYGGGAPIVRAYRGFGARQVVPIYGALDPEAYFQVAPEARFASDLSLLSSSTEEPPRLDELFVRAAHLAPEKTFVLGGGDWSDIALPGNVRRAGPVTAADRNAFHASAGLLLNLSKVTAAAASWSPATAMFEAAGAGACLVSEYWDGIEEFFHPGDDILVARDAEDVARYVRDVDRATACAIGESARSRVLTEHTYAQRARIVDSLFRGRGPVVEVPAC